jgi:hypothetical protein
MKAKKVSVEPKKNAGKKAAITIKTHGKARRGRPKNPTPTSPEDLAVMSLFGYDYPADLCQLYSETDAHVKSAESEFTPGTSRLVLSVFETAFKSGNGKPFKTLAKMIESGPKRNKVWEVIINTLQQGRGYRSETGKFKLDTRPATAEEVAGDVMVFCRSEFRTEPEDSLESLVQIVRKLAKRFNLPILDKRKLPDYKRPEARQETAGLPGSPLTTHRTELDC